MAKRNDHIRLRQLNDVMLDALKAADDAINPKDKRISLHEWHGRLKLTTSKILNAIALAEKGKTNG
jgi:hypothetical protein